MLGARVDWAVGDADAAATRRDGAQRDDRCRAAARARLVDASRGKQFRRRAIEASECLTATMVDAGADAGTASEGVAGAGAARRVRRALAACRARRAVAAARRLFAPPLGRPLRRALEMNDPLCVTHGFPRFIVVLVCNFVQIVFHFGGSQNSEFLRIVRHDSKFYTRK